MKHHTDSLKCLRRATASIAQSDFIDKRCQQITMVCPHSPYEDSKTDKMVIAIHLYDEAEAKAAFGADGWTPSLSKGNFNKAVDEFEISYSTGK